ncbi:MAG: type I-E CRISPR-associated protein Cse2/CasB [Gemmatimonadetes bacterium]|nr:type I-E CRISPR-associated protein Cse2/CasB [Gemmatimonadota bacterium]MYB72004.1 type I-E CRISPR-associated protein Cse2/CasB [Gemmatimonadota bacterium]
MQHNSLLNAVESWRQWLHSDHGDRGARARLKRCESVFDALLEPETHRLIASVHGNYVPEQKLAILALVLARVENTANYPTFADALGLTREGTIPTGDARPRLSPMRFSTLLRASEDADEFARALRRALAILGDTRFNVRRFIGDVLFFTDQTRQKWTFEYYHTRRADATEDTQPQEETQL